MCLNIMECTIPFHVLKKKEVYLHADKWSACKVESGILFGKYFACKSNFK